MASAATWAAGTGSFGMPMIRPKTFVEPPGSTARAVLLPAIPLAASFSVPSPPNTATTSTPRDAASCAKRVAWPRRLVSTVATSATAPSACCNRTVLRAVTDDANEFTINSSRKAFDGTTSLVAFGLVAAVGQNGRHERRRLREADPGPGHAGRSRPGDQDPEARGQAHPRRVRQLRRRDGAATGDGGRRW